MQQSHSPDEALPYLRCLLAIHSCRANGNTSRSSECSSISSHLIPSRQVSSAPGIHSSMERPEKPTNQTNKLLITNRMNSREEGSRRGTLLLISPPSRVPSHLPREPGKVPR